MSSFIRIAFSPERPEMSGLRIRARSFVTGTVVVGSILILTGCGSPSKANIALRMQNDTLGRQVVSLKRQVQADQVQLADRPTTPSLSPNRLEAMYTTHGIALGRLTGVVDGELKVFVVPTDDDGDVIKAAGTFTVAAYDLTKPSHPTVGTWSFDADATRKLFYAKVSLYTYVLPCPIPPGSALPARLTVHVAFTDALTGRTFVADRDTGG